MTVYEVMDLFVEGDWQVIELYDCDKEKTLYKGEFSECPERYHDYNVESIDNVVAGSDHITLNVSRE